MLKKSANKATPPTTKKSKNKEKKEPYSAGPSTSFGSSNEAFQEMVDKETNYNGFGIESIQCIAEQVLNETVSNDICQTLAEDVTFKIREIFETATINMRQGKRKYLKVDDINAVFKRLNIEKIYGPSLPEWITFGDPQNYSCVPNKTIDLIELATKEITLNEPGDIGLNYKWLEDTHLINQLANNNSLSNYLEKIINAVCSAKKSLRVSALKDVAQNVHIGPIIPQFSNFCFTMLKENDSPNLRTPVLELLEAIMFNPCASYSVEEKQATLLVLLLLENVTNADDNMIDEVTPICRILGRLCLHWPNLIQIITEKINKHLLPENLHTRLSAPVIHLLTYLGSEALNYLLWPYIDGTLKCISKNNLKESLPLCSTVLNAASIMYRQEQFDIYVDAALYMEFGDSVIPIRRFRRSSIEKHSEPEVQTNWLEIKLKLLKTRKIHAQQPIKKEIKSIEQYLEFCSTIRRRTITIVGYKSLPIKRKYQFENTYKDDRKTEDFIKIITGRRTLITLKRVSEIKDRMNLCDLLTMM